MKLPWFFLSLFSNLKNCANYGISLYLTQTVKFFWEKKDYVLSIAWYLLFSYSNISNKNLIIREQDIFRCNQSRFETCIIYFEMIIAFIQTKISKWHLIFLQLPSWKFETRRICDSIKPFRTKVCSNIGRKHKMLKRHERIINSPNSGFSQSSPDQFPNFHFVRSRTWHLIFANNIFLWNARGNNNTISKGCNSQKLTTKKLIYSKIEKGRPWPFPLVLVNLVERNKCNYHFGFCSDSTVCSHTIDIRHLPSYNLDLRHKNCAKYL